MLDELRPSAKSSLRQITDALLILRRVRVQQDLLFIRYATSVTLCTVTLSQSGHLDPFVSYEVRNTLNLLINSLRETAPSIRHALQSIEDNVSLFTLELDFSIPTIRKDGGLFLQNITQMLNNIYENTERLQIFRSHIADFGEIEEMDVKEQTCALIESIDDALALSNRYWFCCKDMEANLKMALL